MIDGDWLILWKEILCYKTWWFNTWRIKNTYCKWWWQPW